MVSQCLDLRIPTKEKLVSDLKAWQRRRNREKARITWLFTIDGARQKLGKVYAAVESHGSRGSAA